MLQKATYLHGEVRAENQRCAPFAALVLAPNAQFDVGALISSGTVCGLSRVVTIDTVWSTGRLVENYRRRIVRRLETGCWV
jgi:hypothetical protein